MSADQDYTQMINNVRAWYRNGTPWGVAVVKVAQIWGIPVANLKKEIAKRRNAVAQSKKQRRG